MKRLMAVIITIFQLVGAGSQTIEVGLFQDDLINSAVVYCSSGDFRLVAEGELLANLEEGDILYLTLEDDKVKVLDSNRDFGHYRNIELRGGSQGSVFRVRPIQAEQESRIYDDNLLVVAGDRYMTLINQVDFDKYLAGVVESEAGPNAEKEFYKAQSILCRTYALKQMDRHETEGFSLCDGTHCQAYKGRSVYNPVILEAILETTGTVLADFNFRLATAAYHSNSGGQTQRASHVWLVDLEYLQSVVDPYSLHQSNAKWRDTISFMDWKTYLLENGMTSVNRIPEEIIYVEQMRRKKYFILDEDSLRMTKIREDWGFRSSFFDMFPDGDSILVWGKGYGHGIGMSQEGAMKMARDGFSYQDIIQFYFHEVRMMDFRDLPASSLSQAKIQY